MLRFLQQKLQPQVFSAHDDGLPALLQAAARFGQVAVITGCDGGVPDAAVPYIRAGSKCYKQSGQNSAASAA